MITEQLPLTALHSSIYTRISTDVGVLSKIAAGKIFDHVPEGTDFPYVRMIGATLEQQEVRSAHSATYSFEIYTDDFNQTEGNEIAEAIWNALNLSRLDLSSDGFRIMRDAELVEFTPSVEEDATKELYRLGTLRVGWLITTV